MFPTTIKYIIYSSYWFYAKHFVDHYATLFWCCIQFKCCINIYRDRWAKENDEKHLGFTCKKWELEVLSSRKIVRLHCVQQLLLLLCYWSRQVIPGKPTYWTNFVAHWLISYKQIYSLSSLHLINDSSTSRADKNLDRKDSLEVCSNLFHQTL